MQLILNNHSLWPSISVSLLFSFLHSRHQGNHISSNQMQFADVLYIAYIIMLYILIAICCFQCMSAYINSLDFHYKSFFFFSFLFYIGVELRRSVLGVHWKDWRWSWNSSTLATSCEELTHWKRPWCWEGLGAGGEGEDRGWDGWMASPTRWAWVWVNSGSWWWTGRPGVLRFMGSQSRTRLSHWTGELVNYAMLVSRV